MITEVLVPALDSVAGPQAERPSNKSSRDLLFIFLFFMDAVKSHSVQLDKMSQNVQDKLKPVTPSVAFSETQSY